MLPLDLVIFSMPMQKLTPSTSGRNTRVNASGKRQLGNQHSHADGEAPLGQGHVGSPAKRMTCAAEAALHAHISSWAHPLRYTNTSTLHQRYGTGEPPSNKPQYETVSAYCTLEMGRGAQLHKLGRLQQHAVPSPSEQPSLQNVKHCVSVSPSVAVDAGTGRSSTLTPTQRQNRGKKTGPHMPGCSHNPVPHLLFACQHAPAHALAPKPAAAHIHGPQWACAVTELQSA